MADDEAARRREIRRRKILEGSEARLKRITSTTSSKLSDTNEECNNEEETYNKQQCCSDFRSSKSPAPESCEYEFPTCSADSTLSQRVACGDFSKSNGQFSKDDTFATNGNFSRASTSDNYTFPKKVSDAETRSFGRTRCDVRRNSTCTQMMMETFQYTSFSLAVLRPWLTSASAFILRIYILLTNTLPVFETIFFPLVMLELAFSAWSQLESQIYNKPLEGTFISGVLLLCGFPETLISRFNSVWNIVNYIIVDFTIYMFFFVLSHFICELWV